MANTLRNEAGTAVALAKRRSVMESGFDLTEMSTYGVAGITLATATSLILKQKMPKDPVKGVVNQAITGVIPHTNRADGTRRFSFLSIKLDTPADATAAELTQLGADLYDLFGVCTAVSDLTSKRLLP